MFSYVGSKSRIVKRYPAPRYPLIIEPFAGSARYSLLWGVDRNVLLVERNPRIAAIWQWLITASEESVLSLPLLGDGEKIPIDVFPPARRDFLALMSNQGTSTPRNSAGRMRFRVWHPDRIAANLKNIRHWRVEVGNAFDTPNQEATWFIDPPYQADNCYGDFGAHSIDYTFLAIWCRSRLGQVIVCENTCATWLPFRLLAQNQDQKSRNLPEGIWTNDPS